MQSNFKRSIIASIFLMSHMSFFSAQPKPTLSECTKSNANHCSVIKVVRIYDDYGNVEHVIIDETSDSDDVESIPEHTLSIRQMKPSTLLFSINEEEFRYHGRVSDLSKSDEDLKNFDIEAFKEVKAHVETGNFIDVSKKYHKLGHSALLVGTQDDADGREFIEAEHTWPLNSLGLPSHSLGELIPGAESLVRFEYASKLIWDY